MARKIKKVVQPDQRTKSEDEDIKTAEAGDFCYFLNERNKISLGPSFYCSFSQKELKGKKREHFEVNFREKI